MRLGKYVKADADRLDYDIDYKKLGFLVGAEVINEISATAEGSDSALQVDSVQWTDTVGKVWLSGGTPGYTYTVTVVMTTDQGRIKEDCFDIRIRSC